MLKYDKPIVEIFCVEVEAGFTASINGVVSEIDGTKEEGEW